MNTGHIIWPIIYVYIKYDLDCTDKTLNKGTHRSWAINHGAF